MEVNNKCVTTAKSHAETYE